MRSEFPRSSRYDPAWIAKHQMGPHPLWLCEWLADRMHLLPGQRVLDLGCGTALSSIFLAREYAVEVVAADLWTDPRGNRDRIQAMGQEQRVTPLRCDARHLPFDRASFDAIISIDSYFYFGTEPGYLDGIAALLKPDGRIGAIMPGLMRELDGGPPEHLSRLQSSGAAFWSSGCDAYRSLDWWRQQWSQAISTQLEFAVRMHNGWQLWCAWERYLCAVGANTYPSDEQALQEDAGRYIGFIALLAQRR